MEQIHEETYMFIAALALVGWILWLFFRRYQMMTQARLQRTESFNRLIEKFGTAKEFAEFAGTEEGKKLLADPVTPPPNPLTKVLRFLQAGILFILIGAAYFVNASRWQGITEAQSPAYYHQSNDFMSYGTLAMLLGVGLLIVAGVTYVFVRRWHLANGSAHK
jgi:hypothetical protein